MSNAAGTKNFTAGDKVQVRPGVDDVYAVGGSGEFAGTVGRVVDVDGEGWARVTFKTRHGADRVWLEPSEIAHLGESEA